LAGNKKNGGSPETSHDMIHSPIERELGREGIYTFQGYEVLLYYTQNYWISGHLIEQNRVFLNLHPFPHSGEKLEAHTQLSHYKQPISPTKLRT
jgi:hypothetical protein